jgi:uncharacterized membrane-anchored protein YjiN (DUF445 family)
MNNAEKIKQLRNHKTLATGLFLLMAAIFIIVTLLLKQNPQTWMHYVRAFSEAAMVGALADWFAVTALFHYPLGIKIPHTNLIENSKNKIGDNLGNFVVDNFLTSENLRPYISKLDVVSFAGKWLNQDKNQRMLTEEVAKYVHKIVVDLDDTFIAALIERKGKELVHTIALTPLLSKGIEFAMEKGLHEEFITFLAGKLQNYMSDNQELIKERVKAESSILIPGFVDNMIAKKLTNGITKFFAEIENNKDHQIRKDIVRQLNQLSEDLKTNQKWEQDFNRLKNDLIQNNNLTEFAHNIWSNIKVTLLKDLEKENSGIKNYIAKSIADIANTFEQDTELAARINNWIRKTSYQLVLRNRGSLGALISQTVGNWEGKDLSKKLELEVGKDLQFIRINGTLVGGIVGLIIYALSQLL